MALETQSTWLSESQRFTINFIQLTWSRLKKLTYSMFGDYSYTANNEFSYTKKRKIFSYLQSKYLNIEGELSESPRSKFTNYNANLLDRSFSSLQEMRQFILKARTEVETAQAKYDQLLLTQKILKGNFMNEIAYEFDYQRITSMGWGAIVGSLICSTIYRRGRLLRKFAVFLTFTHLFGQSAYRLNLDKYFDNIYPIFEQDAIEFAKQNKLEEIMTEVQIQNQTGYVEQ